MPTDFDPTEFEKDDLESIKQKLRDVEKLINQKKRERKSLQLKQKGSSRKAQSVKLEIKELDEKLNVLLYVEEEKTPIEDKIPKSSVYLKHMIAQKFSKEFNAV